MKLFRTRTLVLLAFLGAASTASMAQRAPANRVLQVDFAPAPGSAAFPLAAAGRAADIYLAPEDEPHLGLVVDAFANDIERVTGTRPSIVHSLDGLSAPNVVLIGIAGHTPALRQLSAAGRLHTAAIEGQWEAALTTVVDHPLPSIGRALVVAGSDRRGTAFALFTLSRRMGVSPWNWWADVPVQHHADVFIDADNVVQPTPSVQYRGIFLNDEDWGLRPWAAARMDPTLHNIGPHTYNRVFELLLRLHANSLWPAMHPGTLAFNAVPENAKLADQWGIVMGSSHSEALLRNNVGEWNEAAPPKGDGPWNYQLNKPAMDAYWDKRLAENGRYENFYTVGLRGVHDTGLETTGAATGDDTLKARLVEQAMADQRAILAKHVNAPLDKIPQVIWLYKESLELYRAGMKVPDDVTLGWTDDNYGYIRQLPTVEEQKRPGGSGIYYHVSYWGFPHDYLWLCTTPPALMREELTKAFDHGVRKYWVLNVGDLKPAELDIDYFMQLAVDEPAVARLSQHGFVERWLAEQFPTANAAAMADVMQRYYQLNFVRKPEFMGFNGYNDGINRTDFNPNAWGKALGQNSTRLAAWSHLRDDEQTIAKTLPPQYASAFFELIGYPVEASAAMNEKFLYTDQSFLYANFKQTAKMQAAATKAHAAYDNIQSLTAHYNGLEDGKWAGIMSSAPRNRHVFEMPHTATLADASTPLPASWSKEPALKGTGFSPYVERLPASWSKEPALKGTGFSPYVERRIKSGALAPEGMAGESFDTVSIPAAHFTRKSDANWNILSELGISGTSVEYGSPGLLANQPPTTNQPWLDYDFTTTTSGPATLAIYLLPTFPLDAGHRLRFAASLDGHPPTQLDAGATGEWHEDTAPVWAANVLRNAAIVNLPLGPLPAGKHTLRLLTIDPGVVFEHLVLTFPGAPPAYPVPPETLSKQ